MIHLQTNLRFKKVNQHITACKAYAKTQKTRLSNASISRADKCRRIARLNCKVCFQRIIKDQVHKNARKMK